MCFFLTEQLWDWMGQKRLSTKKNLKFLSIYKNILNKNRNNLNFVLKYKTHTNVKYLKSCCGHGVLHSNKNLKTGDESKPYGLCITTKAFCNRIESIMISVTYLSLSGNG